MLPIFLLRLKTNLARHENGCLRMLSLGVKEVTIEVSSTIFLVFPETQSSLLEVIHDTNFKKPTFRYTYCYQQM